MDIDMSEIPPAHTFNPPEPPLERGHRNKRLPQAYKDFLPSRLARSTKLRELKPPKPAVPDVAPLEHLRVPTPPPTEPSYTTKG